MCECRYEKKAPALVPSFPDRVATPTLCGRPLGLEINVLTQTGSVEDALGRAGECLQSTLLGDSEMFFHTLARHFFSGPSPITRRRLGGPGAVRVSGGELHDDPDGHLLHDLLPPGGVPHLLAVHGRQHLRGEVAESARACTDSSIRRCRYSSFRNVAALTFRYSVLYFELFLVTFTCTRR